MPEETIPAREFRLPGIEELTKEQEEVLALPHEGRHLIVGGPGTGKTVVCLLRARRLGRAGASYRFLVWNRLLHQSTGALFNGDLHGYTWERWLERVFRACAGDDLPRRESSSSGNYAPIDWPAAKKVIPEARLATDIHPEPLFLVIDEGQDMPLDFYHLLAQFGFLNFFVAMDQNQQIGDENCSRKKLRAILAVRPDNVIKLKRNHRNSYPVARLARCFHTGDRASPRPDLPPPTGDVAPPVLYRWRSFDDVAKAILEHWDRDPRRLIGVIAPNNQVRERYFNHLRSASYSIKLDNGQPRIETHYSGHEPRVRFHSGGILVINVQACKGQEFDSVFLADIDEHVNFEDADDTRKRFYVMVSRARNHLALLMQYPGKPWIEKILPSDPTILTRREI